MKHILALSIALLLSACAVNIDTKKNENEVVTKTESPALIVEPTLNSLPSSFDTFADNTGLHFEPFFQADNLVHYFDTKSFTPLGEVGNFGYNAILLVDVSSRNRMYDTPEQAKIGAVTMWQGVHCRSGSMIMFRQRSWTNKQLDSAVLIEDNSQEERLALTTNSPAWLLCNKAAEMVGARK